MDSAFLLLIVLLVLIIVSAPFIAIGATLDVFRHMEDVWPAAGYRRSRWAWQGLTFFVLPVMLVYSGVYWFRVRPRLVAAERRIAVAQGYPVYEFEDRRWSDRLIWARRSPANWERAARQWWVGLVGIAPTAIFGGMALLRSGHRSEGELVAAGFVLLAVLLAAWRAGFWYAEHMRLTGRRPAEGGRLARVSASTIPAERSTPPSTRPVPQKAR
jgi:hypothetical protein